VTAFHIAFFVLPAAIVGGVFMLARWRPARGRDR
jgi:hypothetical protein